MFAGQFCQQDQSPCYRNGLKCGGHGQCFDARCHCEDGFEGQFCDCPISNQTCLTNRASGELCFGRGQCHCGRCKCSVPTSMGTFCEHCAQCDHTKHCHLLRTCIPQYRDRFCISYFDLEKNETIKPNCDSKICTNNKWIYQMETSSHQNDKDKEGWFDGEFAWFQAQCSQVLNGCVVAFDYQLIKPQSISFDFENPVQIIEGANEQLMLNFIITNLTEACPIRINAVQIAIGSFVTVILAGLICIIILKCVTSYIDHREFEKFKKEIANANFALVSLLFFINY